MALQWEYSKELDDVVHGVTTAYEALRANNDMGLYTSAGAFYNHTFFGRDASSTVALVAPFDHEVGRESIVALAALQGTKLDTKTQEEPGRIHHEYRNFASWSGKGAEKWALKLLRNVWGGNGDRLLTYFAADATASYINLVHTYARDVDGAILDLILTNKDQERVTVRESVASAADWLLSRIGEDGVMATMRSNPWSLTFQTYQDSLTSYAQPNGDVANFKRPLAYIEVQGLTVDALRSASELIEEDDRATIWRHKADTVAAATIENFWMPDEQYFASALEQGDDGWQQIKTRNVSASWILNSSIFHNLDNEDRERYIPPIVRRLFSDEFLTDLGLRTCSIEQGDPLKNVIEYHGSWTVWPMFTYLAIHGLQKHHMVNLARQLEHRLVNALNWSGGFDEFFVIDDTGKVLWKPTENSVPLLKPGAKGIQMFPEQKIAFTIVPAMTIAHEIASGGATPTPRQWQKDLESEILGKINHVELYKGDELEAYRPQGSTAEISRTKGGLKTAAYMLRQTIRLKK